MPFTIKRVYEPASGSDGTRVLVDRLWPRGLSKEDAAIDLWAKELAPSTALRRWYGHDPARAAEFRRRYFAELAARPEAVLELRERAAAGRVTLLHASREPALSNARALADYLDQSR